MKPALEKKNKNKVSHGPALFFFSLKRMKGNRSDGADSTVTATSSRSLIFWDHGDKRNAGGGGVCHHGNILRGRVESVYQPEKKTMINGRVQSLFVLLKCFS